MLAVLCTLPATLISAGEGVPVVRGEKLRDFARITFEWPRTTFLQAEMHGNVLAITFDRTARSDLSPLVSQLSAYIDHAQTSSDGKTLLLTLNDNYRIRSFVSGTINGVDILPPRRAEAAAESKTVPEAAAVDAPERPPHAHMHARIRREPKSLASASPAAKTAPAGATLATAAPTLPPSPRVAALPAPAAQPQPSPALLAQLAPSAGTPATAPPKAAPSPVSPDDGKVLRIFASPSPEGTVLRFPWRQRVASAVFAQDGELWIVFNKPVTLDLDAVRETAPDLYPLMHPAVVGDATVLRVAHAQGASVTKAETTFEWQVTLGIPSPPPERLRIDTSTAPPLPPYVFIQASELAEPLRVDDPALGDRLIITPSYQPGRGIFPARRFVDFTVNESVQGIVIHAIADDTVAQPLLSGLRVTTARGATLSPNLPPPPEMAVKTEKLPGAATLFPAAAWQGDDKHSFIEKVQAMQLAIAAKTGTAAANPLRLQLAQFYLNEGMAVEAIGMLQQIRRIDSQFFISNHLSALLGAADFLMYRFADAGQDFAAPELAALPEMRYWRAMTAELLGTPNQRFDYLAYYEPYIRYYPVKFQQRLAIVAADRAVGASDYIAAVKILDTLKHEEALTQGIGDYIAFLTAKISAGTGKLPDAVGAWQGLVDTGTNPVVVARAQFALIGQQMKARALTQDQAIAALERLRLTWRGDALELEVLAALGDLYQQRKDYVNALGAWRDMASAFPNTPQTAEALPKMSAVFIELFDRGGADALPPLTQLALYYDYRDLTPSDETGDRIVEGLADRLVSLDLLEQAAALLEQRVRFTYEKTARSRAGAKLARIYLLNREPEKALTALQASMYGDNPEPLRTERDYLAARGMMETGQYRNALALISNDTVEEADDIRLRSYWKQKDWPKVIATVEASLKNRISPTAPASPREADRLVQLALAYTAMHEQDQLRYLRDYFGPLMTESPRKAVFDFITRENIPVTPDRFADLLKNFDEVRNFLHNYRVITAENTEETPPVAPPPAPAAPALAPAATP